MNQIERMFLNHHHYTTINMANTTINMATIYMLLQSSRTDEEILILKTKALIAEMMEQKVVYKRKETKKVKNVRPYKQPKRYTKMIR